VGDGFTFVLQDENLGAVGPDGGGLGYGPPVYVSPIVNGSECDYGPIYYPCPGGGIGNSLAIKFDLHNNSGEGANSTGIYLNGTSPTVPSNDLTSSGINLQSGHAFHAKINSWGSVGQGGVALTITDLTVYKVYSTMYFLPYAGPSHSYIPTSAWAGFTAGTGATPSTIKILNFTWTLR